MDFYRIENENGLGPYHSGDYHLIMNDGYHPTPWHEGLWDPMEDSQDQSRFVCGFADLQQLKAWFSQDSLKNLAHSPRNHHALVHFETHPSHMRVGKAQAVARKSFLTEVSRQELSVFVYSMRIPDYARSLTYEFERVKLGV